MQIRRLDQVGRGDLAVAGGKGANLGELVQLGLPVPNGFVLTAQAYAAQVAAWDLAGALAPLIAGQNWEGLTAVAEAQFREQPLAAALAEGILTAYRELGAPPVAVRSSATAEDLADASFAGQQETFLNVQGEADLLQAVRACWASLWGRRAVHYRQQRGIDHLQVSMAVVVQEMVPAEAAGVLFTVDPVARRSDRMLVEAAPGLGEAVVSGDVTGDLYRIDRGGEFTIAEREVRSPGSEVLSVAQVLELAQLGLRLERHFGCPQDVEFAVAGGRLWLLQARPITTPVSAVEPEPVPPDPKLDFMQRMVLGEGHERYPVAPKPLDQIFYGMMIRALTNAMRLQGYAADPEAEAELRAKVWHTVYTPFPPLRPTPRAANHVGLVTRTLARDWQGWWEQGPRPRLLEITRPVDVTALSDQALFDRADAIMGVWDEIFLERFGFSPTLFTHLYVRMLVSLAVGPRRAVSVTSDLLTGLQTATEVANNALWQLSREARQDPRASAAIAAGRFDEVGEEFRQRFAAFLAEHGHREGATWYLSTPTWRQEPLQAWRLLQGLVAVEAPPHGREGRCEAAMALVERRFRYLPWLQRRFRWLVERVRAMMAFRENSHADLARPLASLQELAAEWGRRLRERGLLESPDDVFYLTYPEVRTWLLAKGPADAALVIARQRETYKLVNGRWQSRQFTAAKASGAGLRGVAASAGVVRARARIVRSEAEWHTLKPGEVLVCPFTNPAWTPLFAVAAAVVTETGGAGAHAAIVAREYGIPAVMGVAGATRLIADGQEILVDGSAGRVVV